MRKAKFLLIFATAPQYSNMLALTPIKSFFKRVPMCILENLRYNTLSLFPLGIHTFIPLTICIDPCRRFPFGCRLANKCILVFEYENNNIGSTGIMFSEGGFYEKGNHIF